MSEEEARKDAEQHYDMDEWLLGERHALTKDHIDGTVSYDAGYNFGIWKQEQASGVHG